MRSFPLEEFKPECLNLTAKHRLKMKEFSSKRIQAGVSESDSEASSEDHDLVLHVWFIVKLELSMELSM